MKLILFSLAVVCLALTAHAQKARAPKPTIKLTTAEVQQREVVYKKTPQGELKLHIFSPPAPNAAVQRPCIVFFFGGAWKSGSYMQFVPQAEYLASRGMIAACADYRISSIHKTTPDKCVEDAKSAMRWVRAHAHEIGVDPEKILAGGGSAGGHLAACTALVPGFDAAEDDKSVSCKPVAMVLFNPALDLTGAGREFPDADGKDLAKAISPSLYLAKDAPPAIIFFGTADKMAGMGSDYLAKAKELGARAELFTAADMPHGFFNRSPWTEITARQMDVFLTSLGYLSGEPTIKLPENAPALQKK